MNSAHLSELRLSLFVLKFIFDVHFSELCPSAHIAEGIGLSFQMGTFCNVGLLVSTGCRGPPPINRFVNPKQIDWRNVR